jgi:hypothetical protein
MITPATIVQRGSGKGRDPWLIRRWLAARGLNMANIAVMARTRKCVVSDTIRGVRNHHRVLKQLDDLGCPTALLYPQNRAA